MEYTIKDLATLFSVNNVEQNDTVVFRVPGYEKDFVYCVESNYLSLTKRDHMRPDFNNNRGLLNCLKDRGFITDGGEFAEEAYEYEPVGCFSDSEHAQSWPEVTSYDFGALTKVIVAIYRLIEIERPHNLDTFKETFINPSKEESKAKTMLQKLSTTLRRVLSPKMRDIYRAGFVNGDLELTPEGVKALNAILLQEHEEALAIEAKLRIDEAKENKV
jgi:hypothetical protein